MSDKRTTPILDGKYEVVGIKPGPIGTPLGEVNLARISEKTAEELVKRGIRYIRKASTSPVEKAKPEKADKK